MKKTDLRTLLVSVILAGLFVGLLSGCETSSEPIDVILDASKCAGATLEELEAVVGDLNEDGGVDLLTQTGETVQGTMYITPDGMTNFVLIDGVTVNVQYWAENAVPYKKQSDIVEMFGIELSKDAKTIEDNGTALRLTEVSEQVCEFWVQSLNSKEKTFDIVRITFDSRYAA